ncbi:MAG: hypothetical protein GY797_29535, partial [Deltaproteobacteria bacterium]|nr:hypothetical protein [Deltaproteobacteria bacterium]
TYFVLEAKVLVHNDSIPGCTDGPDLDREELIRQRKESIERNRAINEQSGFNKLVEEENRVRSRIRFEQGDREEFRIHYTDERGYQGIRQVDESGRESFHLKPSPQEITAPRGGFFVDATPINPFDSDDLYDKQAIGIFIPRQGKGPIEYFIAIDPKLLPDAQFANRQLPIAEERLEYILSIPEFEKLRDITPSVIAHGKIDELNR